MRKSFAMLGLLAIFAAVGPAAAGTANDHHPAIPPELTTAVEMSRSDVNRVSCPGTMNDLIFSREKGVEGHFAGSNAFIKFRISKKGDELTYAEQPVELFAVCDNTVYSLIITPRPIPSVTLRLAPPTGDNLRQNISRYEDLPLEKRALQLIRTAATGDYPGSYRVMRADIEINLSSDLDIHLRRVVDVEGVGLRLKEFAVSNKSGGPVELTETDFLAADIGESILAVALEQHKLAPRQATRLLVVEQRRQP